MPPYQHKRKARSAPGLEQTGLMQFFGDEEREKVIAAFIWQISTQMDGFAPG